MADRRMPITSQARNEPTGILHLVAIEPRLARLGMVQHHVEHGLFCHVKARQAFVVIGVNRATLLGEPVHGKDFSTTHPSPGGLCGVCPGWPVCGSGGQPPVKYGTTNWLMFAW